MKIRSFFVILNNTSYAKQKFKKIIRNNIYIYIYIYIYAHFKILNSFILDNFMLDNFN